MLADRLLLAAAAVIALAVPIGAAPVSNEDISQEFFNDLEICIRQNALVAAEAYPTWGNGCMPPTFKVDLQAAQLRETLAPIHAKWGYQAALWCTFYSTRMGEKFDPNNPQPNNPHFRNWYETILCPWDVGNGYEGDGCGDEWLGKNGPENNGFPAKHGSRLNFKYLEGEEQTRQTMSCGLCGALKRTFGEPPFNMPIDIDDPGLDGKDGSPNIYYGVWDMHPFGAWIANDAAENERDVDEVVALINKWRASNGEEMHGYLWQSLRLLAQDNGRMDGNRISSDLILPETGEAHAIRVCLPTFKLSYQSRDDCAHAAGHGFFYYYMDIGRAMKSCWTDLLVEKVPDITAKDLLRWRWLCSSGIYHSAGNSVSSAALKAAIPSGLIAEELMCKVHADEWGPETSYFARCAAGLGMDDVQVRMENVRNGLCKPDTVPTDVSSGEAIEAPPEPWEQKQLELFDVQQRTCDPATWYGHANDNCPAVFQAHFFCDPKRHDYGKCQDNWHYQCDSMDSLRRTFLCDFKKAQPGMNQVFEGDLDTGIWGGQCLCPDGHAYWVGDIDNCGALACTDGQVGVCNKLQSAKWAFRKVVCAPSPEVLAESRPHEQHKAHAKIMLEVKPISDAAGGMLPSPTDDH